MVRESVESRRLVELAQERRHPRSTLVRRAGLALATAALATLGFAAPAAATTDTFNYTGAAQTWTVPAGVTQATFELDGAAGGDSGFAGLNTQPGGLGARVTATLSVTPGQVL